MNGKSKLLADIEAEIHVPSKLRVTVFVTDRLQYICSYVSSCLLLFECGQMFMSEVAILFRACHCVDGNNLDKWN